MTPAAAALRRSLDIYYRDPDRARRMESLLADFVPSKGLVFDIGAHLGDRSIAALRLGARVVAVEPQPRLFRALRLLLGRSEQVSLHQAAIGDTQGTVALHVNAQNPTVTTASPAFIAAAADAAGWDGQVWDQILTVPMTTLDALIAEHGLPDFVKIDVEGYEKAVLDGLSHPIATLSFEFTTIQREVALACLDRLSTLAPYRFAYALGESHTLSPWHTAQAMGRILVDLPHAANSGDIYAQVI